MCNQVTISGKIVKIYPVRETPSGTSVVTFVIQHNSRQIEAEVSREVKCRLFCILVGNIEFKISNTQDNLVQVTGFLSQNAKSEIVLHVKEIIYR